MQHENTISEHLRDLLDVYPEVNISGIGLFAIVSKSAWIDSINNELYPPTKTLSIGPESPNAVDFISEVEKKIGNESKGYLSLKEELISYFDKLNSGDAISINGIGEIGKGANGQISLVNVHPSWGEGTTFLPVMSLSPILDTDQEAPVVSVPEPLDIPEKVGLATVTTKNNIWKQSVLPLIVLGIGLCLIMWYFKRGGQGTEPGLEKEVLLDSLNSKSQSVDTLPSLNAKYEDYLTTDILRNGCKIVVGSYNQRENAQSQLTNLSALGYNVDLIENGSGYRVIITFECELYNLKVYLDKIKQDVASNAWYLSPRIEPEDLQ